MALNSGPFSGDTRRTHTSTTKLDSYDLIFWPINIENYHWVADVREPFDGAFVRFLDTSGNTEDRRRRLSSKLHDLVPVMNVLGAKYN